MFISTIAYFTIIFQNLLFPYFTTYEVYQLLISIISIFLFKYSQFSYSIVLKLLPTYASSLIVNICYVLLLYITRASMCSLPSATDDTQEAIVFIISSTLAGRVDILFHVLGYYRTMVSLQYCIYIQQSTCFNARVVLWPPSDTHPSEYILLSALKTITIISQNKLNQKRIVDMVHTAG